MRKSIDSILFTLEKVEKLATELGICVGSHIRSDVDIVELYFHS